MVWGRVYIPEWKNCKEKLEKNKNKNYKLQTNYSTEFLKEIN
jgi:hypothetical protein